MSALIPAMASLGIGGKAPAISRLPSRAAAATTRNRPAATIQRRQPGVHGGGQSKDRGRDQGSGPEHRQDAGPTEQPQTDPGLLRFGLGLSLSHPQLVPHQRRDVTGQPGDQFPGRSVGGGIRCGQGWSLDAHEFG